MHWQQYAVCSLVQIVLAPCDSTPQAVNCSSGRLYCFYEKFCGWHKEKVFVSLQARWSIYLGWMFGGNRLWCRRKHKCDMDTGDSWRKSKWCFFKKDYLYFFSPLETFWYFLKCVFFSFYFLLRLIFAHCFLYQLFLPLRCSAFEWDCAINDVIDEFTASKQTNKQSALLFFFFF